MIRSSLRYLLRHCQVRVLHVFYSTRAYTALYIHLSVVWTCQIISCRLSRVMISTLNVINSVLLWKNTIRWFDTTSKVVRIKTRFWFVRIVCIVGSNHATRCSSYIRHTRCYTRLPLAFHKASKIRRQYFQVNFHLRAADEQLKQLSKC